MTPGLLTSAVFLAALASLTAFVLAYLLLAPWHRNPAGRALMVMSTDFWLVTVAQVLRHPFGLSAATSTPFTWFQAAAGRRRHRGHLLDHQRTHPGAVARAPYRPAVLRGHARKGRR